MKSHALASALACAALAFAGASLCTAAHAQGGSAFAQPTPPQTPSSQHNSNRQWTQQKSTTHSWSKTQPMGSSSGSMMGTANAKSKQQKCSQKAFSKGLWGSARKRFIKKCMQE